MLKVIHQCLLYLSLTAYLKIAVQQNYQLSQKVQLLSNKEFGFWQHLSPMYVNATDYYYKGLPSRLLAPRESSRRWKILNTLAR